MATKNNSTKSKNVRTNSKSKASSKKKESLFQKLFRSKAFPVVAIAVFAAVGSLLIVFGFANPMKDDEVLLKDQPERGIVYEGKKVKTSGPCKGAIDLTTDEDKKNGKTQCGHIDPGPEGKDVRERAKTIDKDLKDMTAYDVAHPPTPSDDNSGNEPAPIAEANPADIRWKGSLGEVSPRTFPCYGTGQDGYRVRWVYVYKSGNANRLSDLRDNFNAIAARMNAVVYNSSDEGYRKQIRFVTNSNCHLVISAEAFGGNMSSYSDIVNMLKSRGYTSAARKYIVSVDGGSMCGQGGLFADERSGQDNYNNGYVAQFAVIGNGCWNYAEPHEFMHTLGAVQRSAPYATPGYHCRDQHDVMCYNDGTASTIQRCTTTAAIWRYDCGDDTYFNTGPSTGWLSTHWNSANSRFLK